jgi:transglutaminase-like putative cysteine protease
VSNANGGGMLPTQIARGGSRPGALLPLAAAAALALACIPTSVLFSDSTWVWPALVTIAAVCGSGGVLRALPVPLLAVPLAQSAIFAAAMAWLFGAAADGGPWQAMLAYRDLVADGVAAVRTTVAPVAGTSEFLALLALVLFLAVLLVETLAVGMGLAGLSGVVLLVMAIAPLGIQPSGSAVVLLAGPALGWALLMAADYAVRLRSSAPEQVGGATVARSAAGALGLGVAGTLSTALILTLAAPTAAETPWLRSWWNGLSGTAAQGTGVDPFVSVEARLRSRSTAEVLRYSSTDGGATYLGMVTLEAFDGSDWRPYEPEPGTALASGAPDARRAPEGPAIDVAVAALSNQYLPLPDGVAAVRLADDDGSWSWDTRTGDVLSSGPAATGSIYRASTISVPASSDAFLAGGSAATAPSEAARSLPPSLIGPLSELAADVTAGAATDYDRAVALQRWFTETGGFSYSLDVPDPAQRAPLLAFLEDRIGFCQQFATAMAALSRSVGVPARVVVGFTGGAPQEDGGFVVTAADAHAWPELWFESVGWVRFEPTPALGTAAVEPPAYTPAQPQQQAPADPPPAAPPAEAPEPAAPQAAEEPGAAQEAQRGWAARLLALVGVVLAGVGLAATPSLVRSRRRRTRLERASQGDAGAAWREIGASACDAGLPWPENGTLRQQAAVVTAGLGTTEGPAAAALPRVLQAVEVAHYAPADARPSGTSSVIVMDEPGRPAARGSASDVPADAALVVAAVAALPRSLADRLLPRSLRHRQL